MAMVVPFWPVNLERIHVAYDLLKEKYDKIYVFLKYWITDINEHDLTQDKGQTS